MGQTRLQIKTTVRVNLDDAGVTFYSDDDLTESIQDAYDDVVANSQCVTKVADNLNWIANLSYYNPIVNLSITDYMAVVAIFNYSTNRWLRDDLVLRDFDRLRRDWENWVGTPQFWTPSDPLHFAIAPKYSDAGGTFKIVYWATAPTLADDTGTFLLASDVNNLIEFYTTADMLEQAQEYSKATEYWDKYYESLVEYSDRVKRNNKTDLLMRV